MKQLLIEKLIAAGEEEQKLAIESGDSHQGVSAVTVVVDGGGPSGATNIVTMQRVLLQ